MELLPDTGLSPQTLLSLRENLPPPDESSYLESLHEILERADILDARAMRSIRSLVELLQQEILLRIQREISSGSRDWGIYWLPQLLRAIDQAVFEIAQRAGVNFFDGLHDAWKIGSAVVDSGVKAAVGIKTGEPQVTPMTLTIVAPYSAALVRNLTEKGQTIVDNAIKTGIILGRSPHEIMDQLAKPLIERGTPMAKVAYEAERIVRTELSRVQDLASQARLNQVIEEFPELALGPTGLKKVFIAVERGPYPCSKCRPYSGKVFDINDPLAPELPMHPNCRCCYVPHFPGLSTAIEPITKRQEKASVALRECCH